MWKLIVFSLLSSFLFFGCANRPKVESSQPVRQEKILKKSQTQGASATRATRGNTVWHLVSPAITEILLEHEKGLQELIRIDTTLSELTLNPGRWKVMGVIHQGVEYESLVEGGKFSFQVEKNVSSYVGSFLVDCPRVRGHQQTLKKMQFFNRYHFTSPHGTCELIVGNDLPKVRRAWGRLVRLPGTQLRLGF